MTDASNVLRIDDKWSVTFDPNSNDSPKAWLRHGEHQGPFIEHNGVVAMFYALRERADLTPSPEVVKELLDALRGMVNNACAAARIKGNCLMIICTQEEWEAHVAATGRARAALAQWEAGE